MFDRSLDPPPATGHPPAQQRKEKMPPKIAKPSWKTINEVTAAAPYSAGLKPVTSGLAAIDNALRGGLRPECVYVIAGRTGMAKSTLALTIARRSALLGTSVLFFKLEESIREAVWRMNAATAQVPLRILLDGAWQERPERDRIEDAIVLMRDLPIRLADCRDIGVIERVVGEHVRAGGQLAILDQMSMVEVAGRKVGYEKATAVSNRLRILARTQRVPIVVVSQVNRPAAKAKDHLTANDLRDSGEIENDAAGVLLVDGTERPPGPQYAGTEPVLYMRILVGKNRYGPTSGPDDPIKLVWWPRESRIEDAADPCGSEL